MAVYTANDSYNLTDRERIATSDGGYVELWYDWQGRPPGSSGIFYLQKYNAAGTAVGAEYTNSTSGYAHVVALSDGGYVAAATTISAPNFGQVWATVFDAAAAVENRVLVSDVTFGQELDIAASPLGGFLVSTRWEPQNAGPVTTVSFLSLYDNSGARTLQTRVSGTLPAVDVLSDGTYRITWTDNGTARSLTVDPRNPPDLSAPAAPNIFLLDDVAPVTGTIPVVPATSTNDTSFTLRFTVTEPGELDIDTTSDNRPDISVAITSADVARGYVDVPITAPAGESWYAGWARITDVNGVIHEAKGFSLRVDTVAPAQPSITTVTDDTGSRTGAVPNGGTTDDSMPTLQIAIGSYNEFRVSDRVQLFVDGSASGPPVNVTSQDLERGYILVTTPALSGGTHTLSAIVIDGSGNVSPQAASYSITVQPDRNSPPVVTVGDHSLGINGSAQVQSWIAYSDADGNAATQYQFWDQGIAGNSGYFSTPSNPHHPSETVITVNAADLANVLVHGGQVAGSENLWVRAFDGTAWSAWDPFNFTTVGNSPPVATIGDHSLGINGSAQIQSWIAYSDADGNAATQYQFWDQGIAASSGYFSTPSNPHHPSETVITVNAADLASVAVHGGQVAGSENLWVRAFDGTAWSQWDSFNFTTVANSPPVVTVGDQSLAANQWAQVQGWISYSDADGNAATQYQFWDQGIAANSAYFWTPSDAHHPSETVITVNAADLANVWVRGGQVAGSENLWVRAFDGTAWSAWDPWNMSTFA